MHIYIADTHTLQSHSTNIDHKLQQQKFALILCINIYFYLQTFNNLLKIKTQI